MYTFEDFLRDSKGLRLEPKQGPPPLSTCELSQTIPSGGRPPMMCWAQWHTGLYTSSRKKTDRRVLPSTSDTNPMVGSLEQAVQTMRMDDLKTVVLPYLEEHFAADFERISSALKEVEGVQPPGLCPAQDNYKWAQLLWHLRTRYAAWRLENKPPVIPCETFPEAYKERKTSIEAGKWEDDDIVVVPVSGSKFLPWELSMLKHVRPDHKIVANPQQPEEEVAVSGYYDPFRAIGSTFLKLPKLPDFPTGSTASNQLPATSCTQSRVPQTALPTPPSRVTYHPTVVGQPAPPSTRTASSASRIPFAVGDGLDPVREYIRLYRLHSSDINRLNVEQREDLKRGVPHDRPVMAGQRFFETRSKAELAKFASLIPRAPTPLRAAVESIASVYGTDDIDGLAWYLACKLWLMRSQVQVTQDGGELYVSQRN
ncbi:unnamed protein product [Acanthoscelides obtectus]|uniref:Uncharacterized protein n=1 Tax=Acanthoscelides obtectus TaxID=200917 RepID=A0A9P0Q3E8_ACAOB|nr:unnamed protein product [Acanthoscelides obtectus]CAK1680495.1 hypothetical protein AOBTE_LOCUS32701 [Acanthoscelides obtectus]